MISTIYQSIKNRWIFLILGILMVCCGVYVLFTPVESYISLSFLFSILMVSDGISKMIFSISNKDSLSGWGWHLTSGIIELILGVYLIIHPEITMQISPTILGFWILIGSITMISGSFDLKTLKVKGWGWVMALGTLTMLFGLLVLNDFLLGSSLIVLITAIAIITYGTAHVSFGIQLKSIKDISKKVVGKVRDLKAQILSKLENIGETDLRKIMNGINDLETKH